MSKINLDMTYRDGRHVPITITVNDDAVAEYRKLQGAYEMAIEHPKPKLRLIQGDK